MGRDREDRTQYGDGIDWRKEPQEREDRYGAPPRVPVRPAGYEYEKAHAARDTRRGGSSAVLIVLLVVLVGGLIFAGWKLGSMVMNYRRDRAAYNDLASNAVAAPARRDEPEELPLEIITTPEQTPASELPITVDWDYLRSVNSDITGWLYCPDTVINYPVVQSGEHEFYLTHGFDGASNTAGTLFADRSSVAGILQSNYIIYGHNMKDKSMFGSFQAYGSRSYYEEHPVLYFLTPAGSWRVELIGARVVEGTVDNFPTYFRDLEAYQAYLDEISRDFYWLDRTYFGTDYQLMTLSTCTSASGYEEARMVVYGMMVPVE